MHGKGTEPGNAAAVDADVLAIRNMIGNAGHIAQTDAVCARDAKGKALPDDGPPDRPRRDAEAVRTGGAVSKLLKRMASDALAGVKSYRPDRRSVLWTSLVLMLLLQPFFVFGWGLILVAAVTGCYLVMGGDSFWRGIIALHQRIARHRPDLARRIKLRAYVSGKKWDSILNRLPDRLADQLRGPDLRKIIAADAAHDAAMSDRLTRLDRDTATG